MVTPIETKQETVLPRPKGGSFGDEIAWFWFDPTQQRRSWKRLNNSPLGEFEMVHPTRPTVSWIGWSNSPLGEVDWLITSPLGELNDVVWSNSAKAKLEKTEQLAVGRVWNGSSNSPNGELDWLIQLTVGRGGLVDHLAVGRVEWCSSNSPNDELDERVGLVDPTRCWLVGHGSSNSPSGELDRSVQLAVGRVGIG